MVRVKQGRRVSGMAGGGLLILGMMAMALVALMPVQAEAQEREMRAMRERIEDLEGQLRSITRYLSNNQDAPRDYNPGGAAGTPDQLANVEVRLSALENQIRTLTGQMEEVQYEARQATERLQRMVEDYEYRLQQLEGGAGPMAGGRPGSGGDGGALNGGMAAAPLPGDPAEEPEAGIDAGQPEPLPTGEPAELYNAALARLRQDNFRDAAQGFEEFVLQFPDHDLTPNAQYWLGEAYYAQQDYSGAARAFLTAYTQYPESSKASGSLLKLGISLGQLDQTQDACAALREFGQKYPNAPPIETNRANLARQDLNCP